MVSRYSETSARRARVASRRPPGRTEARSSRTARQRSRPPWASSPAAISASAPTGSLGGDQPPPAGLAGDLHVHLGSTVERLGNLVDEDRRVRMGEDGDELGAFAKALQGLTEG